MRKQNGARRLSVLSLTLALLVNWNTILTHSSAKAAQVASDARLTRLSGLPASRAAANGRIAFASDRDGNYEIYTMNPDGSDVKRLTFDSAFDSNPIWSPDGSKILFVRDSGIICVMNADGSNQISLTSFGGDSSPSWSPDSREIVSVRSGIITVISADATNTRQIRTSGYVNYATWSPDGAKIAFSQATDASIYVMNADGSNQRAIVNDSYFGAWSPDGSKIVVLGRQGLPGLWVINIDGSNPTRIDNPQEIDGYPYASAIEPAWSPDGSKIAFIGLFCDESPCLNDEITNLAVVNADGSNEMTIGLLSPDSPTWSPDGTKILFANGISSAYDLFVMNPDGSGLTNITNTSDRNEWAPSWQALSQPLSLNPIDDAQTFVRQQYLDFLGREPDAGGLAYWTERIIECGIDQQCIHERRVDVSAAFFIEQEFQETGFYVYRFYRASLGRQPNYAEFYADRSRVVAGSNLEANKQAFADDWTQRSAFINAYPATMSNTEFVNELFDTAGLTSSTYDAQRQQEIQAMNVGRSRALVLRDVIEISDFRNKEYNRAFVRMQYFGYLKRDPDADGEMFWLDVLNNRLPNDSSGYRSMVCAFLTSAEYQLRFGTVITRNDHACASVSP